jgi:ABC-2 type transport system permease protein
MVFVLPMLIAGLSFLTGFLGVSQEEQTVTLGQIGVVDLSRVLAAERERPPEYVTFADVATAAAALEEAQIGAYFLLPADYLTSGSVEAYAYEPIPVGIENQMRHYLVMNLLAHRSPLEIERLLNPAEVAMATLDGRINVDERTGTVMILTPVIFIILFVMSISMTSSYLMENVVEEKETRMVEMITTSITPQELLRGKIIGLSALGLFQIGVWVLVAAAVVALRQDLAQIFTDINYPPWLLALSVL